MTLGSELKKHRSKLRLTIRDVQEDLNLNNVCRYENNVVKPSFETVVKMARYYKANLQDLAKLV